MKELTFANGDTMPALGLGTWKSAPGEVGRAIEEAIDLGYRHFDCAWIYQNEAEIGRAFQRVFARGDVTREELWITSKLWCNRHRDGEVAPALEGTLRDLACEYLDLYLVHWPVALAHDVVGPANRGDFLPLSEVPLRETWGAMERCAELGLTRHVGVSNYSVKHLSAHLDADIVPEVNQVEMHPYLQQPELLRFCGEHGIHLTAYSPLGSSDRPETMKAADEPVLLADPAIAAIAAGGGRDPGAGAARVGRPARHERDPEVGRPGPAGREPRGCRARARRGGDGRDRRPRPGPPLRRRHLLGAARQRLHRGRALGVGPAESGVSPAPRARPGRAAGSRPSSPRRRSRRTRSGSSNSSPSLVASGFEKAWRTPGKTSMRSSWRSRAAISSSKAATEASEAIGSAPPEAARTIVFEPPTDGSATTAPSSRPWMLATASRSTPARSMFRHTAPPMQ